MVLCLWGSHLTIRVILQPSQLVSAALEEISPANGVTFLLRSQPSSPKGDLNKEVSLRLCKGRLSCHAVTEVFTLETSDYLASSANGVDICGVNYRFKVPCLSVPSLGLPSLDLDLPSRITNGRPWSFLVSQDHLRSDVGSRNNWFLT